MKWGGRLESMILGMSGVGGQDAFGAEVEIEAVDAFVANTDYGLV